MQRDHVRQRSRWYGTAFSPLSLFFSGANGAWYDPSDFSTMFQDAAGTTPVTAVGQPVGRILDKSGRGNHAYNQSGNSANYPILQQDGTGRYYLAFNGVNQWLQTNSIDFTYGDKMFVSAGVRKLSDAARGMLLEHTTSSVNVGSFGMEAPDLALNGFGIANRGNSGNVAISYAASAPTTRVLSGLYDLGSPLIAMRLDGVQGVSSSSAIGRGGYANANMYIGARGGSSLYFNGRLYGLVVAGKAASDSEIASTEAWLNQKTGAY